MAKAAAEDDTWFTKSGRKAVKQQEVSAQVAEQETAITALFRGKLTSTVACAGMPPSQTIEPFNILLLHIQSDSVRSVAAALDGMTASEMLTDYKPHDSAAPTTATKTVRLSRLPQILILQLVRVDYGLTGSTKVREGLVVRGWWGAWGGHCQAWLERQSLTRGEGRGALLLSRVVCCLLQGAGS